MHNSAEWRAIVKNKNKKFPGLILVIFFALLLLIEILVLKTREGAIIFAAIALILTALLKPKYLYLSLISLLSLDGFAALENVSFPKIVSVLLMIGLAVRLAMTKKAIPEDSSYKYFILFFAGCLVSFTFAINLSKSVSTYITYISLFMLYIFTRLFLRKEKDIHDALNYLFISTLLAFVIVQIFGLSVSSDISFRISGGLGDPNGYAAYIMVLIPLALYRVLHTSSIARILYWGCLLSFLTLLILTGSRGGMLGFLGVAGILIYHYSIGKLRQISLFLLIAAILVYFIAPDVFWQRALTITNPEVEKGHAISIRLDNYKAALKMFLDYPFAGVGLSNFRFNSREYGASGGLAVHNTYLEILTGGGLLTFIPFTLILINLWRKLKLKKEYDKTIRDLIICLRASFVSILITSFFISADKDKITWLLFALISSVYYSAQKNKLIVEESMID